MKFLSFEILYIFFIFQILNFKFFFENFDPLAIVYRPPYPWYIDPSTHGILTPLSMVYWPPYPWYTDSLTHGISTPLPMVFWPPYPWYIDTPTHGILNPLPMVYRPPYQWYFGPLPIEYRPLYTWYFDPPAYLLIRNGGSKYHTGGGGGSVFNKGVQYTMDVNWPWVQFTMGFKIPYDTGITVNGLPSPLFKSV